jgi:hypothetical protein
MLVFQVRMRLDFKQRGRKTKIMIIGRCPGVEEDGGKSGGGWNA